MTDHWTDRRWTYLIRSHSNNNRYICRHSLMWFICFMVAKRFFDLLHTYFHCLPFLLLLLLLLLLLFCCRCFYQVHTTARWLTEVAPDLLRSGVISEVVQYPVSSSYSPSTIITLNHYAHLKPDQQTEYIGGCGVCPTRLDACNVQ